MRIPTTFNKMGLSPSGGGGGIPTSGLVMYHPLSEVSLTPSIGSVFELAGTAPSATTEEGIPCLLFNNGAYKQTNTNYWNYGSPIITLSIWGKCLNTSIATALATGSWAYRNAFEIMKEIFWKCATSSTAIDSSSTLDITKWHHLCGTLDKTTNKAKFYIDGNLIGESSYNINLTNNVAIGAGFTGSSTVPRNSWFYGYLAAARIYDRVLTDEEIALLASEFYVQYEITVQDLTFSLYQKNETYSISYSSPGGTPTFEIIEGSLPNTISFNTSTGQFSGKGLTDADHTYNLKVRLTAPKSIPATCNVTIYTYKTARISLSNQTFNFVSNKAENKAMTYSSDETVTFTIESGTLPAGMSLSSGRFYSSGTNTSADTQQVVIRAISPNNQTGVTATMTINMQMNAVVLNAQTFNFYTEHGVTTQTVAYSGSLNTVSDAVFSMTGTLPAGVTWDATTGSFTSDGTQTTDETASVSVTVSSSNGTSTSATATMAIEVHVGEQPIPTSGLVFYAPLTNPSATQDETGNTSLTVQGTMTNATYQGISCLNFDGGYIELNKKPQDFGTSAGTWSIWFNLPTNASGTNKGLLGGPYPGFRVGILDNRQIEISIQGDRTGRMTFSSSLDTWYNFVITFNGSVVKAYLNGVQASSVSTSAYPQRNDNTKIGTWNNGAYPTKYMTACRIYNRVLSDEEIALLASEFTPTT